MKKQEAILKINRSKSLLLLARQDLRDGKQVQAYDKIGEVLNELEEAR